MFSVIFAFCLSSLQLINSSIVWKVYYHRLLAINAHFQLSLKDNLLWGRWFENVVMHLMIDHKKTFGHSQLLSGSSLLYQNNPLLEY